MLLCIVKTRNVWRWFSLTTGSIREDSDAHTSCIRTHAYRLDTASNHIYHDAKFVRTNLTYFLRGRRKMVRTAKRTGVPSRESLGEALSMRIVGAVYGMRFEGVSHK